MLLDQQNCFHDGDLAAGANNGNVIDMGAPTDLGALGVGMGHGGEGAEIFIRTGTEANADNTLAYTLEGADDEAMSVNKINIVVAAAADIGGNGQIKRSKIPHHTPKRYFRLVCTTAGTTGTNLGFKAFLHTTANQRSLAGNGLI
jgi:hypothetical protein